MLNKRKIEDFFHLDKMDLTRMQLIFRFSSSPAAAGSVLHTEVTPNTMNQKRLHPLPHKGIFLIFWTECTELMLHKLEQKL